MKTALCAAAIGVAMLSGYGLSAQPAQAGYIVDLTQQGSNIVATGNGAIDLTGLEFVAAFPTIEAGQLNPSGVDPLNPAIKGGSGGMIIGSGVEDQYFAPAITEPANFGSGGVTLSSSDTGDPVDIASPFLGVPHGYVSDSPLSDTSTYLSQTLSSLGVTPGTYEWTWGSGANQNFTLEIGAAVPEASTWAMMALGFGLLGLVSYRKTRSDNALA
jgi:PEP-CTERM motif